MTHIKYNHPFPVLFTICSIVLFITTINNKALTMESQPSSLTDYSTQSPLLQSSMTNITCVHTFRTTSCSHLNTFITSTQQTWNTDTLYISRIPDQNGASLFSTIYHAWDTPFWSGTLNMKEGLKCLSTKCEPYLQRTQVTSMFISEVFSLYMSFFFNETCRFLTEQINNAKKKEKKRYRRLQLIFQKKSL